jgi:hypothetical protein
MPSLLNLKQVVHMVTPYTLLQLLEDEMRIYFRMSVIIPMIQTRSIYKTSLIWDANS